MALYAIGDLHLCLGAAKPMDIFGGAWLGYMDKLKEGLSVITEEDTTILLGDLSWALDLDQAKEDFAFINAIPGSAHRSIFRAISSCRPSALKKQCMREKTSFSSAS